MSTPIPGGGRALTVPFRHMSLDYNICQNVLVYNEYDLPLSFAPQDRIIDIGAHIGAFTCAVLERGAGYVYSVEAHPDNYRIAAANLQEVIAQGRVILRYGAVWRSDAHHDTRYHSGFPNEDIWVNTGGVDVLWATSGQPVPLVALDELIQAFTLHGSRRIRLLKMDCEGAEWPILFTANQLHLIDAICGEYHEIGGEHDGRSAPFTLPGWQRFTCIELMAFLHSQGFSGYSYADRCPARGKFFATRLSA